MTSRIILVLLAMMWSAFATAAEVVNEPEHNSQWLAPSSVINANDNQDNKDSTHNQSSGNAKKEPSTQNKRSRLDGMFDLLLPSGLRDNR